MYPPPSVRIWAVFLFIMEIPDYKAKALWRHLKRIIECARCDPADTRTANALRLAKEDARYLDKLINNGNHTVQK